VPALGYLLSFSTYGTHLPGSQKDWVDAQHCLPNSPLRYHNPSRETYWKSRLSESPYLLDRETRSLVLDAILAVCAHRQWIAHAVHVRSTHVHAVVFGEVKPERMLADFKAYATRSIRSRSVAGGRSRHWAIHESTRYLWNETSVKAAIEYVLNGQGTRMSCYPDDPI
jgi:hypothetical protein